MSIVARVPYRAWILEVCSGSSGGLGGWVCSSSPVGCSPPTPRDCGGFGGAGVGVSCRASWAALADARAESRFWASWVSCLTFRERESKVEAVEDETVKSWRSRLSKMGNTALVAILS